MSSIRLTPTLMVTVVRLSILVVLLRWTEVGLLAAVFSDSFSGRETIVGSEGVLVGSNVGATVEPSEPRHCGKRAGRSVWVSWVAPSSGLLTLSTEGSSFDTVVAAYVADSKVTPPLAGLHPAGGNDDREPDEVAELVFSVQAGTQYEIAVAGYASASGSIVLEWEFTPVAALLPLILRHPLDRAIRIGDTLILTVDIRETEAMELQWMKGLSSISGAGSPNLVIKQFKPTDVGQYRLRIRQNDVIFYSSPIEVEINSEGLVGTLARNKFEDAWGSGLYLFGPPPELAGLGAGTGGHSGIALADIGTGVTRGYNGSQIFNTTSATRDPSEPAHCGIAGGASYWFSYQPPVAGNVSLDTEGSDFDTVLAVYQYNLPLTGFEDLIPVICDDNSGSDGLTSKLQFDAEGGRLYFVVVDGVNGARGIAHLNYRLATGDTNAASPPLISQGPQSQDLAVGVTTALAVHAEGTNPLYYQWFLNNESIAGQTNATLTLSNVQSADAGGYRVQVSNEFASVSSDVAQVGVVTAPFFTLDPGATKMVVTFPAVRGLESRLEWAPTAFSDVWTFYQNVLTDAGGMIWFTNLLDRADARFFRIRKP